MNPGTTWDRVDRCARSFHERATVHLLRGVLVVRTAEQTDPVRSVEMRSREPVAVIELQGASFRAPPAMLVGEGAAATVALEDRALDRVGNVTRTRLAGAFGRALPRRPAGGEALLLHMFDQQIECSFEDRRQVSVGDAVPEQVLGLTELVTTRAARGELKLERFLRERCNHGPAFIASRWRCGWRCEGESRRRGATGVAVPNANAGAASGGELGRSGSLRTTVGTGGCGERRATSSSISRFDLPAASASTLHWLSVVRCGASKRNPVRWTFPERTASRITGKRRAARATLIRLQAVSSENPSSPTQKANIEEKARSR